ncbi:hypothetical protein LAV73_09095 [Lysinibacillus xylanilyticus]|uniref:hypothetical protein n=1 Tax=Lysinibacillus xylanilyticus TaxID=582475 RepID=UPI002B24B465|nr:hypothetical protein [Lysinibacillus xylanilyticus]MEB2280151.1 hypothetical protein [Lysinibacillus xylanilyticus]
MSMLVQYIVVVALIITILYVVNQYYKYLRAKRKRQETIGVEKGIPFPRILNKYTQKGYNFILRIPILRTVLIKIRKKIETLSVYDEYTLRREVMKIIFSIIALFSIGCLVLLVIRPSWLIVFWILLGILLLSGVLVDFFVYRVENRLLVQLKNYLVRVTFNYQQTKMVDEAVFDSIQYAGPEMKVHAERINKILNDLDSEKELAAYEEVAPSRYLRVFAGLAVLVKDRGDNFDEKNGSSFVKGLTAINKELNDEILYRSKLSYALRSLSTLALIPIFLALPTKNWSISQFPTTESFYGSRIGFLSEIAVYAISVACYLIVRKMKEINDNASEFKPTRLKWEAWLFKKIPLLEKLCEALSPQRFTKKYHERQQLIKDANENLEVKELTLQQILSCLAVFIIFVTSFTFAHFRETNSVLNQVASQSIFTSQLTEKELVAEIEKNDFDRSVIKDLKDMKTLPSEKELREMIADQLNLDVNDLEVTNSFNRISGKWQIVSNSFLQWWEVLISIVIAIVSYFIPVQILISKRKARLKLMEREVYQLLVLISILRDFEGMSVSIILNWLQRFSIAFKKSITIAIEEFDSGPELALVKLSENNTFEPFQQIVERLKLTLVRLSIKEAFNDIEMEREFYLEQRREDQKRSLEKKGQIGEFLGLGPLVCLTFIYLIFPIIYIGVKESNNMINMLK